MSRAESMRRVRAPRHKMFGHLLPALSIMLLLLGCACGPAYAADGAWSNNVTLFSAGTTKVPAKVGGKYSRRSFNSFASPFLVGGNGVLVALAEGWHTGRGKKSTGIVARYIETEGPNWAIEATEKNGTNWKSQWALRRKARGSHSVLRSPTAVIRGNKIHLLALTNRTNDGSQNGKSWHFGLAVGEITGEVGSKKIEWGPSKSLRSKLTREVQNKGLSVFPGSTHSAFLTSKGTIVFSANAKNTENTLGFAIMQLKVDEEQWEVSFVANPGKCRVFSLFEWKQRLTSAFSGCQRGNTDVKEYDETTKGWKDADDTLLHVWTSERTSKDFTHVTIGNKSMLLFTDECYPERFADGGQSAIRLGFTDGSRVHDAHILTQSAKVTSGGLLYINGELFSMYQDTDNGLGAIVLTRLNHQMETIKSVSKTWDAKDAYLSKPCNETVPEDASPDTLCVTPMPTDGLVGFLSNESHLIWYDEYRFRDALVNGRALMSGYTFSGAHSGAQWHVGQVYSGNRYDFAKYGLTVVATVIVHETPKNDTPLLTVNGDESYERLGLWYKDKQWKVVSNNGDEEPAIDLETQKEYRVAIVIKNNNISVYVNGSLQGRSLRILPSDERLFIIQNIYIAGYRSIKGINTTVTNVLLYNRVLNDTELAAFNKTIATATPSVSELTTKTTTNSKETPETTADSKETPKAPTDPKEDSSEHVRVGATLLFLLGVGFCALLFSASI